METNTRKTNTPPAGDTPFIPEAFPSLPEENGRTEAAKTKISRRRFLKLSGLAGGVVLVGGAVDALAIEPHGFCVTRHTISLPGLGGAWDGVRIAQISDVHVGRYSNLDDARTIVETTNDLEPDIVALTGDYVSHAGAITPALVEVLRDLRAKQKFAVLGNHDYWSDGPRMIASLASAGIPVLTNRHVLLRRNGQPLCIGGVNDVWSTHPPPDVSQALAGVAPEVPRIVLCHNPDYAEVAPREVRIDLMLCGHTHGGQVRIPFLGPLILPIQHKQYAEGLVQGPTCPVFISRGLGMVTIPVRFNCRPEIPLLTLRNA